MIVAWPTDRRIDRHTDSPTDSWSLQLVCFKYISVSILPKHDECHVMQSIQWIEQEFGHEIAAQKPCNNDSPLRSTSLRNVTVGRKENYSVSKNVLGDIQWKTFWFCNLWIFHDFWIFCFAQAPNSSSLLDYILV